MEVTIKCNLHFQCCIGIYKIFKALILSSSEVLTDTNADILFFTRHNKVSHFKGQRLKFIIIFIDQLLPPK